MTSPSQVTAPETVGWKNKKVAHDIKQHVSKKAPPKIKAVSYAS